MDKNLNITDFANFGESSIKDFITLTKPGVTFLVLFSAFIGLLIADITHNLFLDFVVLLAITLSSCGAAAINMWYDADIDAIMKRTKTRPIPAGKIPADEVLNFGIILSITSFILMFLASNFLASFLLIFANLFYSVFYTMYLKRRFDQNIVIGGAAGAFPPVISYAAVTGNISLDAIFLFLIIFFWTPPHFWALALFRSDDYKLAKIPMLPVTKGVNRTILEIFIYTICLSILPILAYFFGNHFSIYFLVVSCLLNGYFLYLTARLFKHADKKLSMQIFGYSIIYLFILLAAVLI